MFNVLDFTGNKIGAPFATIEEARSAAKTIAWVRQEVVIVIRAGRDVNPAECGERFYPRSGSSC